MKAKYEPRPDASRQQQRRHIEDLPESQRSPDQIRDRESANSGVSSPVDQMETKPVSQKPVDVDSRDQDRKEEATQTFASAVVAVGQILKVRISDGVYHLDFQNPSETTVKEISEILATLKGIVSAIEQAVKAGESMDVNGLVMNTAQLADVAQQIKQQIFKIEFAVNTLGMATVVGGQVDALTGQDGNGGIAQAIDPATRQMAAVEVGQLLGTTGRSDKNQVHQLLEKLAAVLKESAGENQNTGVQLTIKTVTSSQAAIQDGPGFFDSKTLRTMLKVDGAAATAKENGKAAVQNDKMDLPKTVNVPFGRSLGDELANRVPVEAGSAVQGVSQKGAETTPFAATKLLHTSVFTPETTVMNQVSEKFSHALRTGLHEVKILLKPESLGEVRLKIQIEGDIVMARIHVENQQVKQIIESNLNNLKNALAEHNLQAGAFSVDVGNPGDKDLRDGREAALNDRTAASGDQQEAEADGVQTVIPDTGNSETGRRFGSNSVEYFA